MLLWQDQLIATVTAIKGGGTLQSNGLEVNWLETTWRAHEKTNLNKKL